MSRSLNNEAVKPAPDLLRLRPKAEGAGGKESAGAGGGLSWVSLCIPTTSVAVIVKGMERGDGELPRTAVNGNVTYIIIATVFWTQCVY